METENFIKICEEASSMADASRKLNMSFNSFKRKATKLGCYKTNQNWSKGKSVLNDNRINSKHLLFVENSTASREYIKGLIIKHNLIEYRCFECGLKNEWNGKVLSLQLDHINGIRNDNRISNLRFLCPNCHTQTETYCSKNKSITVNCLNKPLIIEEANNVNSLTQLLRKLGLCETQSNRRQIKKILADSNLDLSVEKAEKVENKCKCGKIIFRQSKICSKCWQLKQRKVERPSLEILLEEVKNNGYCATGRKYSVSDNTIRKWIKNLNVM
jgi:5-methylcytosine-specific restriction endonuclease McrA